MIMVLILIAVASVFDVATRRIPNWLTVAAILVGLGGHTLTSQGSGIVFSSAGLAVGMVLLLPSVLLGGMGAGDLKLLAAVGALTGPMVTLKAGLFSVLIGGIIAIGVALRQGTARRALRRVVTLNLPVASPPPPDAPPRPVSVGSIPYGVAIGLGVLLCAFIERV
jgi:prepilin peptidase CpaA